MTRRLVKTTVTINQWRIKSNAHSGENEPVICINKYEIEFGSTDKSFGNKIGDTLHVHEFLAPRDADVYVKYLEDGKKTPCGASAWMEYIRYE